MSPCLYLISNWLIRIQIFLVCCGFPIKFGIIAPISHHLTTSGINRFKLLEEFQPLETWEYLFEQQCEHDGLKHLFLFFNILISWVMYLAGRLLSSFDRLMMLKVSGANQLPWRLQSEFGSLWPFIYILVLCIPTHLLCLRYNRLLLVSSVDCILLQNLLN